MHASGPSFYANLWEVVVVLLNRRAGPDQTTDLPERLATLFDKAGIVAHITILEAIEDTGAAVASAIEARAEVVVAGGGDGTVNHVAHALVDTTTPLGVIPLGTLNHFAKDLRIPLDLEQAVQTIASKRLVQIDVGEVNGRVFLNNSSLGLYPNIVVERETLEWQGYRRWNAWALATMSILRRYRGVVVTVRAPNETLTARVSFVFVGNNEYEVSGLQLGGRKRIDGGVLVAYLATSRSVRELIKLITLTVAGRAHDVEQLRSIAAAALDVESIAPRIHVAIDGEVLVMSPPLHYRVRPRALSVVVPPD